MNRSWKKNSNSSPGYVYFNTNNTYQNNTADTSDFLSFEPSPVDTSSPKLDSFSPCYYSSPNKYQKISRHVNLRNVNRYLGYSNRSSNSSSNSFNSSYNNSRRRGNSRHRKNFNKVLTKGDKKNISGFFDDTSLEDPWAELEKDLKKKRDAEISEDNNAVNKDDSNDSPIGSEDEQNSESENKSDSSMAEDDTT